MKKVEWFNYPSETLKYPPIGGTIVEVPLGSGVSNAELITTQTGRAGMSIVEVDKKLLWIKTSDLRPEDFSRWKKLRSVAYEHLKTSAFCATGRHDVEIEEWQITALLTWSKV